MALAPRLAAEQLWLGYGGQSAVQEVSLAVRPGDVVALIGPNGSGKSTLLKGLARLLPPQRGAVLLDGRAIQIVPSRQVARQLAILPQNPESSADLTVGELVALGRWPHRRGWLASDARQDPAVVQALAWTALTALAHRPLAMLSGGERQRAWIAMALAQTPTTLLLDEPTTVLALHDLQQAAWLAHRLVVLKGGCLITQGPPRDVLTPALIAAAFGVRVRILWDAETGRLLCMPLGRSR